METKNADKRLPAKEGAERRREGTRVLGAEKGDVVLVALAEGVVVR